ncbi:hydroxypyruvate isomerase family protein [Haloarcula marina]|uniref:hydroxypyruvate isomerase family protein n=1 Tax=Haloarcula marina TaxID=2961574 RepID=UPI0020B82F1E|nr:TIM barrel protein [Halomicroarcula marina]
MPSLSVCIEMVFADRPLEERIERAAAAGADAVEFWGWQDKDLDAITEVCADADVELAAMLGADAPLTDPASTDDAVHDLERSIEVAAEFGCPNLIVTVGPEQAAIDRDAQHDAIVTALSRVAPMAEDAGITLGVEPLNTAVDHPEYYLTSTAEGREIVRAVDSPAVGLLFDVYHQQITEGDVTRSLTDAVDDLTYVHVADNPGRNEPGTGELNYETILSALAETGYDGYVGCEFSPVGDDSEAVERCRDLLPD